MKEQDDLHALIGSMSGSEKRYFKVNAIKNSKGGSGRFMELFEAIDKGRSLPKKGKENRTVTANYLTDSILHCLDLFHEKNSIESQLEKHIRHGVILYDKGLNKQSLKTLVKAEKVAKKQQDFVRLQLIYWHMRTLLAIGTEHNEDHLNMEYVLENNLRATKETELIARLRFVHYRFQKTVSEVGNISDKILKELVTLLNSEAMKDVNEQSGFFSQLTANQIWSQYYMLSNNLEAGLKQGRKVFDLCCSHRDVLLQERGRMLIASANNYMMRCFRASAFSEMKRVLFFLEQERPKQATVEIMRLETYYSNLLAYHICIKDFKNTTLLPQIDKHLNEIGFKMNQTFLMFIYSLGSTYAFFQKDLHNALTWINNYLNHENRQSFVKNLSIAHDYRLIIYYEQSKLDLLENLLKKEHRPEDPKNEYPLIRNAIRNFLNNELKKGNQHQANLTQLRNDLNELKESKTENEGFEFFPFDEWVDRLIG